MSAPKGTKRCFTLNRAQKTRFSMVTQKVEHSQTVQQKIENCLINLLSVLTKHLRRRRVMQDGIALVERRGAEPSSPTESLFLL